MSKNSSPPPKQPSRSKRRRDDFVSLLEQGAKPLIGDAETVVLAVSGGADSMAMLYGWLEAKLPKPVVAHFDHRMRRESAEDARFVAARAARLELPFELGEWSDKPIGRIGEKAARDARYQFLFDVAKKHGASAVAVAHTRDDQAETILFRIVRGTGVEGLKGMAPVRGLRGGVRLIRPMLAMRRNLGREFLVSRGLSFREDASNTDASRTRNRIRHELIPLLESRFNPAVVDALGRIGDYSRDSMSIIEAHMESLWNSIPLVTAPDEVIVPLAAIEELIASERVLLVRLICSKQNWSVGRMTEVAWRKLAGVSEGSGPKRWIGPNGLSAARTGASFIIRRKR